MKGHNNGISEEHIVAYLDGELNVNGEMREALGDGELRHVAKEYAILKKIFNRTVSEPRFVLSKQADMRALAYLHNIFRSNRSGARMVPDAGAMQLSRPAIIRTKNFWAKRSLVGFALVIFLGAVWFITKPNEVQPDPSIAANAIKQELPQTNIKQTTPAPTVLADNQKDAVQNDVVTSAANAPSATAHRQIKRVTPVASDNNADVVENSTTVAADQQEEKPADIMISRRYAKLIKDVHVVEVTQQDKM